MELLRLRAETKEGEEGMKYALYDIYEAETPLGELICTSNNFAEIRAAAKLRREETDWECDLLVMERLPDYVLEELQKEEVTE